jgi:hypothetical protein
MLMGNEVSTSQIFKYSNQVGIMPSIEHSTEQYE